MEINVNIQEVTKKLSNRLLPGGWQRLLSNFLDGPEMRYIIEELVELKRNDEYFVPSTSKMFRYLELCPVHKLRVLILIDSTHNRLGYDGIPLNYKPPSKIGKKLFDTITPEYIPDIEKWYKQGVLMAPVSPTSTIESTANRDIWKSWTTYLVSKICEEYPDIPVIMIGKRAHGYLQLVRSPNKKIVDIWPKVDHHNCWIWCNTLLKAQNQVEIEW